MSTEMKTGLVLSGGGAVGAYQAGVVKALDMLKNGVFRGSDTQFSTNAVNNILHAPFCGVQRHIQR